MTSVSAVQIILTPTQSVGAGGHSRDETHNLLNRRCALLTELSNPPLKFMENPICLRV